MTNEKILEIARRYDPDEPDFFMTADTLIAFARAVIEAERERIVALICENRELFSEGGFAALLEGINND